MAKFLTTKGISHNLEEIIKKAERKLILVSPYLKISKALHERLADATNRGVEIVVVYGKDELKPNERNGLAKLSGLRLYYCEDLHAKCYMNEASVIITSMNMYEFSEQRNREMGVFVEKEQDVELYLQAFEEVQSILNASEESLLQVAARKPYQSKKSTSSKPAKKAMGYCIRCETRIVFDASKPLCLSCFDSWSKWSNPDYVEDFCHSCGEFNDTSFAEPICSDCTSATSAEEFSNYLSANQLAKQSEKEVSGILARSEAEGLSKNGKPTAKGKDNGVQFRRYMGNDYLVFPGHLHAALLN
jgi:hypothetical protein